MPLRPAALATSFALLAAMSGRASAEYRVVPQGQAMLVHAAFRDFQGERIGVDFAVARRDVEESAGAFGPRRADVAALLAACNAEPRCDRATLAARLDRYYLQRGWATRLDPIGVPHRYVAIDRLVRRDAPRLRSAAAAFARLAAAQGASPERQQDLLLAFVQSALAYRSEPVAADSHGFSPPAQALGQGWGDCDTKAALLAALLLELGAPRMVGVHVPGHYLLGIARHARKGDAQIRFGGENFVLVEPAGPAML
ncbi:MAG TPA: hypothetical protein VM369_05565, partial [Candidatus Binatia bacterium]|nr:hypothetical protein [Candidatus Binatia bacterium]